MVCRLPLLPSWIPFTILLAIYMSLVFGEIPGDKDFNNGEAAEDLNSNSTKNYTLTGIPQLDYVHDPNLPRELNGYNLSSYPFLNRVPTTNYSCEGLKDGFYASVEFKCQLYHQCLFGNRYDFLCANYTAFDQRTFICHFVSEVDCPNSASFFHRNDALYIAPTTTSAPRPSRGRQRVIPLLKPERFRDVDAPKTSSPLKNQEPDYAVEPSKAGDEDLDAQDYEDEDVDRRAIRKKKRRRRPAASRRRRPRPRRPIRRRRPPVYYDDYYDEEEYDDYSDDYQDDYEDERVAKPKAKNKGRIKNSNPVKKEAIQSSSSIQSSTSAPPPANDNNPSAPTASSTTAASQNNSTPIPLEEIYSQSRPPPKIRPPVPKHVMSKYTRNNAYEIMHGRSSSSGAVPQTETTSSTSTTAAASQPPKQSLKTDNTEYVEYDYEPSSTFKTNRQLHTRPTFKPTSAAPARTTTTTTTSTTTTTTTTTTPKPSEAPEYEYYEYEDDAPQPPQPSPPSPTTSTTTTTTTPKPNNALAQHRRLRNRKPDIAQEVVYSTSNSPVAVSHDTSISVSQGAKTANMNDRFLRRSKPSVNTYTNDNQGISESTVAFSSTTPELPSSTTLNSRQQQQPQQNFNARFPSYEVTNSKPSDIQTVRPSRFWQRQQKIVTSTTTTLPPQPEYVEYYEDPVPVRYGQKSASTYTQQYQPQPESTEIPQRMVNYNSSPRYPQTPSNMRPLDQSNFVTPYATREPVNQMRPTAPEFISLLQDDDSSYYSVDPHNPRRFHNTPVRQYSAAQETFPSYAPPPPTFGQYLKRIHQRHVAPQSYPWY